MIVLDTHALVFYLSKPEQLSERARKRIEEELSSGSVGISAITPWEIAMLVRCGRLSMSIDVDDWIARATSIPRLSVVPIDAAIALRAAGLPDDSPADPVDRFICATALVHGAALVTKDRKLRKVDRLSTVW